jgi:4-diphosphocytidyl-2-C-methyl-D-erythritol kinase
MRLSIRAPAKLNTFLHIVGRRADGYHLLETAFDLVDWYDEVELAARADGQIVRIAGAPGVAVEDDLVVRAARRLQTESGVAAGCEIRVRKSIPIGAGLGGGSADAAAVLLGLDQLWGLGVPRARLAEIGLGLGADVPVFIGQGPAFAEGVGERLTPLPFRQCSYFVVHPGVGLATPAMFAAPELVRDCPTIGVAGHLARAPVDNVFLPVALARSVGVRSAVEWLQCRFGEARLTGSGSAVYAPVLDLAEASARLAEVPAGWQARVVSSVRNWFDNPHDEARK